MNACLGLSIFLTSFGRIGVEFALIQAVSSFG